MISPKSCFLSHIRCARYYNPFTMLPKVVVFYRTSVAQGTHNPFIISSKSCFLSYMRCAMYQQVMYYFSKVMFFNVHPLRKIRAANVLFYQSRVFYRTSFALGCAGLLYAAMGWGRLLRAAPGCFGRLLAVLRCAKPPWVALRAALGAAWKK